MIISRYSSAVSGRNRMFRAQTVPELQFLVRATNYEAAGLCNVAAQPQLGRDQFPWTKTSFRCRNSRRCENLATSIVLVTPQIYGRTDESEIVTTNSESFTRERDVLKNSLKSTTRHLQPSTVPAWSSALISSLSSPPSDLPQQSESLPTPRQSPAELLCVPAPSW